MGALPVQTNGRPPSPGGRVLGFLGLLALSFGWPHTGHATTDTGAAPTDTGAPTTDTGATDTGATATDTGATVDLDVDADLDGWTLREGDCDDTDRDVNPGMPEICNDGLDNDCDGLVDEGCDDSVRFASLRGGGGCTANSGLGGTQASVGPAVLLLLVPLWSFWWRRRR